MNINCYTLKVEGKNLNRFLKYLYTNKIEILKIKKTRKELIITVSYNDYYQILKLKNSYKITIISITGIKYLKIILKKYKVFFIFFVLGIFLIIFFSSLIFNIEIDLKNGDLKNKILKELNSNGIAVYNFKKNYNDLNKIKANIKNKYINEIEWLEIENDGVICKIKVIERLIEKENNSNLPSNIIATKDGLILDLYSRSGELIKNKYDYVNKGDVIISGIIHRNEDIVNYVRSQGIIYAETWYKVSINYPTTINELSYIGKEKTVYSLNILGKEIKLSFFNKNMKMKTSKKVFATKSVILNKNKVSKYKYIKVKYTDEQIINKIKEIAKNKIINKLDSDEKILSQNELKIHKENDTIYMEIFFKVKEKIGQEQPITEEEKRGDSSD